MRFKERYIFVCLKSVNTIQFTIIIIHYSFLQGWEVGESLTLTLCRSIKTQKSGPCRSNKLGQFSVHIYTVEPRQGTEYGCSTEVWYIKVLFLIFYYYVPFNSKTANPPPGARHRGTYPGHLTGVFLRTVVNLTQ